MKRTLLTIAGLGGIAGPIAFGILHVPRIFAQTQQASMTDSPAFEVASIKPTPPPPEGGVRPARLRETPGGIDYYSVGLFGLVMKAYGIKDYQLSIPREYVRWTNKKWDIVAHAPPNAASDRFPLMIRTLLVDRFELAVHREYKELPVYALIPGKSGSKLKAIDPPESGLGFARSPLGGNLVRGRVSLDRLTSAIAPLMGRPVIDMTEQLGLKLEPRRVSLDVLVVDAALKVPVEN